jgi:Tfp pilus assembly PilM family ATPase
MVAAELEDDEGGAAGRVFDFWRSGVGHTSGAGCREISVLSLRSDTATAIAEDLLPGGFCCRTLDGLPFALSRAVEMTGAKPGRHPGDVRAAVDLGASSATFVLCRAGQPSFTRVLRGCPFADVVDDLGGRLGVPPAACGPLLRGFGLADLGGGPAGVVRECLSAFAGRLTDELRRTLAFLKQQSSEALPRELLLFGGGAVVRDIGPALSEALALPVRPWELPSTTKRGERGAGPSSDAVFGAACAMSVLSLRQPGGDA